MPDTSPVEPPRRAPAPPQPSAQPSTLNILRGLARDAANYARDLAQLFSAELGENTRTLRRLAAMAGAAALLAFFSLALLTAALAGAVAYAVASWRWSLLLVGAAYALAALALALTLARRFRAGLLQFRHTRRRLREDRDWIKQKLAA